MVSLRIANRPYSERKISETFLDFVAPLMAAAGAVATKGQVEQALKIAFTVWNSVVFDTKRGNTAYLTRIRQLTVNDPVSAALVEQMISRKRALFGDDLRLIGEYRLTQKNGEWRLWAEARDPVTSH